MPEKGGWPKKGQPHCKETHAVQDPKTGLFLDEPEGKAEVLTIFFSELFSDPAGDELPKYLKKKTEVLLANDEQSLNLENQKITIDILTSTLRSFSDGKTSSDDHLVAEMCKALVEDGGFMEVVREAFQQELDSQEESSGFSDYLVNLVQKKKGSLLPADFRPIAILDFLYKWFSKCLLYLSGLGPGYPLHRPQFAFRKDMQAAETVHLLRNVVEKTEEWQVHSYILDGDLHKAYDSVKHNKIAKALKRRGVRKNIIRAWLRSIRGRKCTFKLDNSTSSMPIGWQ